MRTLNFRKPATPAPLTKAKASERKRLPTPKLNVVFFRRCCVVHGVPAPEVEWRFHPVRKWRFDLAWPKSKVALEIEGGIFTRGAHGSITGILRDLEKYNAAAALGWRILRVEPKNYCVPSTFALIAQTLGV